MPNDREQFTAAPPPERPSSLPTATTETGAAPFNAGEREACVQKPQQSSPGPVSPAPIIPRTPAECVAAAKADAEFYRERRPKTACCGQTLSDCRCMEDEWFARRWR